MTSRPFLQSNAGLHREEDWTLSRASSVQSSSVKNGRPPSREGNATHGSPEASTKESGSVVLHRKFVFTDPIAFRLDSLKYDVHVLITNFMKVSRR